MPEADTTEDLVSPELKRLVELLCRLPAPVEPELLDAHQAAVVVGHSESWLHKANRAGRIPAPIRLGRSIRWRKSELLEWIAAGAPHREKWEQMRGQ